MRVYTTGQVAKICKVAPRTVSKWFDAGKLKGYRIPGGQDRRIPRIYLITFLKEHGMEIPAEVMGKVALLSKDQALHAELKLKFENRKAEDVDYCLTLTCFSQLFSAGISSHVVKPQFVLVDFSCFSDDAEDIVNSLREVSDSTIFFALLPDNGRVHPVDRNLFQEVFKRPFNSEDLLDRLKTLSNV